MNRTIDCKGMVCPQPVLRAKEVLEEITEGTIEVIVDNEASRSNVERFARSRGCAASVRTQGDAFHVMITKTKEDKPAAKSFSAEDYPCELPSGGLVYVIPSETMGRGDEELGKVLIRAFIKTIKDVAPLPAKIFFYNAGVRLTATDSDLIAPLAALESRGVEILSCGTCLDFLNLKKSLKVGQVTNMYDIMESMNKAAKVVSPL